MKGFSIDERNDGCQMEKVSLFPSDSHVFSKDSDTMRLFFCKPYTGRGRMIGSNRYNSPPQSFIGLYSTVSCLSFMLQIIRLTPTAYAYKMLYISSYNMYLTSVHYVKDVHSLCTCDGGLKGM